MMPDVDNHLLFCVMDGDGCGCFQPLIFNIQIMVVGLLFVGSGVEFAFDLMPDE